MRISDWSSDVCSSDLVLHDRRRARRAAVVGDGAVAAGGVAAGVGDDEIARRTAAATAVRGRGDERDRRVAAAEAGREGAACCGDAGERQLQTAAEIDRPARRLTVQRREIGADRKSTTSELQSLMRISYAVFCLKKQ